MGNNVVNMLPCTGETIRAPPERYGFKNVDFGRKRVDKKELLFEIKSRGGGEKEKRTFSNKRYPVNVDWSLIIARLDILKQQFQIGTYYKDLLI